MHEPDTELLLRAARISLELQFLQKFGVSFRKKKMAKVKLVYTMANPFAPVEGPVRRPFLFLRPRPKPTVASTELVSLRVVGALQLARDAYARLAHLSIPVDVAVAVLTMANSAVELISSAEELSLANKSQRAVANAMLDLAAELVVIANLAEERERIFAPPPLEAEEEIVPPGTLAIAAMAEELSSARSTLQ